MKRFWEIDLLRGVSLVFMVAFNYSVALKYFGVFYMGDGWAFEWLFPRIIASLFILLAGISLWLSWSRAPSARRIALRGARIFAYGMAVTLVTWIFFPAYMITFGILHLIGVSIMLSIPFLARRKMLPLALLFILMGAYLGMQNLQFSPAFWLVPQIFQTFDYFPLLPWFGVFLLGVFIGSNLYDSAKRRYGIREAPSAAKPFMLLGRRSLFIYLIHQPVLLALLYFTGFI
ncbi:MAG: DUF1624 domain-containing protein [Candidatus Aenigmarchaeota archaeon]|nr:DUF1624 domain-containing protein [Candidatus Aenigmarchaeota archaeon]